MHRAHPETVVTQGKHSATVPDLKFSRAHNPLTMLHFSLRTREQFTHKIVIGGRAYERNGELHPSVGDVRRHLYDLHKKDELEHFWQSQVLDTERLERRIQKGSVVRDIRLRDFLRKASLD